MPRVSVCLPTYNGATYLPAAIASILAQTLPDFELLIVDDCSTDQSVGIAHSVDDPRLRVFQNSTRLGLVGNWNRCLELARGDYLCLFHQDDVMLPDNLAEKVRVLNDNQTVGLVYSDVNQIDPADRVIRSGWSYPTIPYLNFVQPGKIFFDTLFGDNNPICCPSVVLRRECYQQLGGFDVCLPFTADWEMWLRIALFFDVGYIARPLVNYRWHGGNETHNFSEAERWAAAYQTKQKILEKYPDRLSPAKIRKLAVSQTYSHRAFERAYFHWRRGSPAEARKFWNFAVAGTGLSPLAVVVQVAHAIGRIATAKIGGVR